MLYIFYSVNGTDSLHETHIQNIDQWLDYYRVAKKKSSMPEV